VNGTEEMRKDTNTSARKGMVWCTKLATTGIERLARSPVLADREWVWMAVRKVGKW